MNRFSKTGLAAMLVAMFAARSEPSINYAPPARASRPRAESVRCLGEAQMKRERRRLRSCGSST